MKRSSSTIWASVGPFVPSSMFRRFRLPALLLILSVVTVSILHQRMQQYSSRNTRSIGAGAFDNLKYRVLGQTQGLDVSEPVMRMDGSPFKIYAGALHYFRVPPEYWVDRLQKMVACGLNTVDTVVPWNLHEPQPEQVTYTKRELDLVKFLEAAQTAGLYAIVRIGPYVGAELDWGGLPAWLLRDEHIKVRSMHSGYISAIERHLSELLRILAPLQYGAGGPVIAFVLEDGYGSYGTDTEYIPWLREFVRSKGIFEPLLTTETEDGMLGGSVADVLPTIVLSPSDEIDVLQRFKASKTNIPLMVGKFSHTFPDQLLSEKAQRISASAFEDRLKRVLEAGFSFSFNMFHGGHNFGLLNGFDTDGILTESGHITAKWQATRRLLTNYNQKFNPKNHPIPKDNQPRSAEFGSCAVHEYLPLSKLLVELKPRKHDRPNFVELLCKVDDKKCSTQNFGFAVYRRFIETAELKLPGAENVSKKKVVKRNASFKLLGNASEHGNFHIKRDKTITTTPPPITSINITLQMEVADRAIIFINRKLHDVFGGPTISFSDPVPVHRTTIQLDVQDPKTEILVLSENLGRVFHEKLPHKMDAQRKGIRNAKLFMTSSVSRSNDEISGHWEQFSLDFSGSFLSEKLPWQKPTKNTNSTEPALYRCRFNDWKEGIAMVNQINLGRYNTDGDNLKTVYIPAPFLNAGDKNEVVIFELHQRGPSPVLQSEPISSKT